jgi:hypothetical protein
MNETTRDAQTQPLSRLLKQPVEWMVILTLTIFLLGTIWFLSEIVISKTGHYQLLEGSGVVYRLDTKTGGVELFRLRGGPIHLEKLSELPATAQ